jgi:hypothetical protein
LGVFERVGIYASMLWVLVLAVILLLALGTGKAGLTVKSIT